MWNEWRPKIEPPIRINIIPTTTLNPTMSLMRMGHRTMTTSLSYGWAGLEIAGTWAPESPIDGGVIPQLLLGLKPTLERTPVGISGGKDLMYTRCRCGGPDPGSVEGFIRSHPRRMLGYFRSSHERVI